MPTKKLTEQHTHLAKIYAGPPKDHLDINAGKLFNNLLQVAGWSVKGLAIAITDRAGYATFNNETVKSWKKTKGFSSPQSLNRRVLVEIIESHSSSHEISAAWLEALSLAWARGRLDREPYVVNTLSSGSQTKYNSCFISYSHENEDFAIKLYNRLRVEGVAVWYAPADMLGGKKIPHQIDEAIRVHDKLLLILSPESIESNWVREEIYKAINMDRKSDILYPISIFDDFNDLKKWSFVDPDTGADVPRVIREYYIPNFSWWNNDDDFEREFLKLLKSLNIGA